MSISKQPKTTEGQMNATMEASVATQLPDANTIRTEARKLGIERHLLELHTYGVTIVPPATLDSPNLVDRLREATLRILAERHKQDFPHDWKTRTEPFGGPYSWQLILEDPAFAEALTHPLALCIARFMCGMNATFIGMTALVKVANAPDFVSKDGYMHLHTDTNGVPSPFPTWSQMVNVSWILSDYNSIDDGPTLWVPGSHRFGSMPRPDESEWWREGAPIDTVPVIAKAGSLAIWNGAVWHGSCPRRTPGLRIALPLTYGRSYLQTMRDWPEEIAAGKHETLLEQFPELAEVLGLWHPYPNHPTKAGATQNTAGNNRMTNIGNNIYA